METLAAVQCRGGGRQAMVRVVMTDGGNGGNGGGLIGPAIFTVTLVCVVAFFVWLL